MSRFEKYKKLREGTLGSQETDFLEKTSATLDLSKDQSQPLPDIKPVKVNTPVTTPELSKLEPDKEPETPEAPKPKVHESLSFWPLILPMLIGIVIPFIMIGSIGYLMKDNPENLSSTKEERVVKSNRQKAPIREHKILDFFITDSGVLINKPTIKGIKDFGRVIGTDPKFISNRNSMSPLEADYTYLLLEDGGRLPVDIAMGWLKHPVDLYTSTHQKSGKPMACLGRPINKCAYVHRF